MRPKRSRAEWIALVDEWRQGGETVDSFCTRKELGAENFKHWERKLRRIQTAPGFLPVAIRPRAGPAPDDSPCRIIVAGAVVIECGPGTSGRALELALRVVVAVCSPI